MFGTIFENYLAFICRRIDGELRVEVGENGQNRGGRSARPAIEPARLVFLLCVCTGEPAVSDLKRHKIAF